MATYNIYNPAEHIQAPQPMSLRDMIGVGQGIQQYKAGQLELQQAQRIADERQPLADFMANRSRYMDENGNIDLNKATEIFKIAPNLGADAYGKLVTLANNQTIANSAKTQLNQDILQQFGNSFLASATAGENKQQAITRLQNLAVNLGIPAAKQLADSYTSTLSMTPEDQNFGEVLRKSAATLLPQETQQNLYGPNVSTVQTPAGIVPMVIQRTFGGGVNISSTGQPVVVNPPTGTGEFDPDTGLEKKKAYNYVTGVIDTTTHPELPQYRPQVQQPVQPANQQPVTQQPTTVGNVSPAEAELTGQYKARTQAQQTASDQGASFLKADTDAAPAIAQSIGFQNQLINLAPKTKTGGGSSIIEALSGNVFARQAFGVGESATDLQTLGHNLAQATATAATEAGFGTDAGRILASETQGTKEWTTDALIKTARLNRAISYGKQLLMNGRQNAFNKSGKLSDVPEFTKKWGSTVTLDGIRLIDAMDNLSFDPQGYNQITQELGGLNSKRYAKAVEQMRHIRTLSPKLTAGNQ